MNKLEKEAIDRINEELKRVHKINHLTGTYVTIDILEILLNLIQKQEAIIDKLAEQLAGLTIWNDNIQEPLILVDKEEVIEYFKKEVEKE